MVVAGYVNFKWCDEEILHAVSNVTQFLVYSRLFYHLMPSRNCNKAQKFGMGFLGVNSWSRDFCGFCWKP